MIQDSNPKSGFKIGTAAKMAGISPNTIRTWMRRNYFSTSMETESGGRLLSSDDLQRLITLKSLIDLGDSIGRIAQLDDESLKQRLAELKATNESSFSNDIPSLADLEAAFVSPASSARLSVAQPLFWNTTTYRSVTDLAEAVNNGRSTSIVLIDFQSRRPGETDGVLEFARQNPSILIVVIFDFAQRAALQELARARVHLLRWPLNSIMIERYLYSLLPSIGHAGAADSEAKEIPPRLLSEKQLSYLAESLPTIKCECPRHVSSLLSSLNSFEDYSKECTIVAPEDKELHEFLYRETARARHVMELALLRLCKEDGIHIPQE